MMGMSRGCQQQHLTRTPNSSVPSPFIYGTGYDPGVNASHAIMLRGIRRFTDPEIKHQPLSARLLRAIFGDLDLTTFRNQHLWGGLLVSFHWKIGHTITFYGGPESSTSIKVNKSYPQNEQKWSGDGVLCPVRVTHWVLKAATTLETQGCDPALSMGRGGITSNQVASVIKTRRRGLGQTKPDFLRIRSHSLAERWSRSIGHLDHETLAVKRFRRVFSVIGEKFCGTLIYDIVGSDSGGPLLAGGVLVSIVSAGDEECGVLLSVYAHVSYALDFIENILAGDSTGNIMEKLTAGTSFIPQTISS
ncbi:hypothetical protein PHMEG_0003580 [Phytophthora megakarya]|uniref:Peptidase S1 domain-containing protein n=1 Tax=Phytophthora megakarya TaxID=4795 RepID=A0A225WXP8_9STRA|nr:hypothetical protein PHMEG_0003580 [Phytophthora megakarya]